MKKLMNMMTALFKGTNLVRMTSPGSYEEVKPAYIRSLNSYSSLLITGLGMMAVASSIVQLV